MEKLFEKLQECKLEAEKIAFDDDTALEDLLERTRMYMSKVQPDNISIIDLQQSLFKGNLIRDVMWGSNLKIVMDIGRVRTPIRLYKLSRKN